MMESLITKYETSLSALPYTVYGRMPMRMQDYTSPNCKMYRMAESFAFPLPEMVNVWLQSFLRNQAHSSKNQSIFNFQKGYAIGENSKMHRKKLKRIKNCHENRRKLL